MTTAIRAWPELAANVVAAAMRWLYDVEQPDDAVMQHHGVLVWSGSGLNRSVWVAASGYEQRPVLRVEVTRSHHSDGTCTDGLSADERSWWTDVVDDVGARWATRVVLAWNWVSNRGDGLHTGALSLDRPARPSLCAAVARYRAGCREHPDVVGAVNGRTGVFCQCGWFERGHERLTWPHLGGAAR